MSASTNAPESLAINSIRTLSVDAVRAANSGHPGTPMALARMALSQMLNGQDAHYRQRCLPCQIVCNSPRFRQNEPFSRTRQCHSALAPSKHSPNPSMAG